MENVVNILINYDNHLATLVGGGPVEEHGILTNHESCR